MTRLTYELNEKGSGHYDVEPSKDMPINNYIRALNKCGQYEDIDEEIGIDYITLNKLRKASTIYVKFFDEIQEWDKTKLDLRDCKIWYGYHSGKGYGLCQPLSNYGKGFALTKEELV